ncbi:MAG: methionyl-tRNA formyltransferase [Tissierellia bacterium]|nr:methionyl-tRNA formyltransferase [Tissierellia bacterium]
MNIVFAGTPEFALPTLEKLYESGYNIPLVISQKDRPRGRGKKMQFTPVKKRALEIGLEVYQPDSINSKEAIEKLRNIKPDCIVVIAYGQILKSEILNLPKYNCINVHASLLPKYRGAAPINWAIINGESETGITIMKMEKGLDTGPILNRRSIPIEITDDSISIHDRLSILGGEVLIETLEALEKNEVEEIAQEDSLSSYASILTKDMGKINWNYSGEKIVNLIRGLKPWPSAYTIYNGDNIKIHSAKRIAKFKEGDNGIVVEVSDKGIFVNCSDECIVIEELQFPGKRKMHISEYLRGNKLDPWIKFS